MIKYPKINESAQRILTVLGAWYKLLSVDLDYSDSVLMYCEIIPDDKKYLQVKLRLTTNNQLSIYEDITGGLDHKDFVRDMGRYIETVGDLDLGDVKIEKWDGKSKEYKLNKNISEPNCFKCTYRSYRGFCNLLNSFHPKKEHNCACEYWTEKEELIEVI